MSRFDEATFEHHFAKARVEETGTIDFGSRTVRLKRQ
jgi:hypothetical protein